VNDGRVMDKTHPVPAIYKDRASQYGVFDRKDYPYVSGANGQPGRNPQSKWPAQYWQDSWGERPSDWTSANTTFNANANEHTPANENQWKDILALNFRHIWLQKEGKPNTEYKLQMNLVQHGVLAISIAVGNRKKWSAYNGGVYRIPIGENDPERRGEEFCSSGLNHAVALTGYSSMQNKKGEEQYYWIIRNSWGTDFGVNGYIFLERGETRLGSKGDPYGPCKLYTRAAALAKKRPFEANLIV